MANFVSKFPKFSLKVKAACVHLCRVEGNTVWSHMTLWDGVPSRALLFLTYQTDAHTGMFFTFHHSQIALKI